MTWKMWILGGAAALAASATHAQDTAISGQIGFGARLAPVYFGSDELGPRPFGTASINALRLGPISFGDPDVWEDPSGPEFRGSFRPVRGRSADDFAELTGLEDIDFSLELGGGLQYSGENFQAFAVARNGVIGHGAWVGEVGADAILRPGRDTAISIGPRALFGSDDYANTYFGITAAEAAASSFAAYEAEGGLISYGFEAEVEHRLSDDWAIRGRLRINELTGDAADSPIVQQGDSLQVDVGVMLIRRFSFGF